MHVGYAEVNLLDIAHRVVAEGLDPKSLRVSAVMTRDPVVIDDNAGAMEALKLIVNGDFSHLPVTHNGTTCEQLNMTSAGHSLRVLVAGKVKGILPVSRCLYDAIGRAETALYLYNQHQRQQRGQSASVSAPSLSVINHPLLSVSQILHRQNAVIHHVQSADVTVIP